MPGLRGMHGYVRRQSAPILVDAARANDADGLRATGQCRAIATAPQAQRGREAVRSFRSALATWQQRLRTLPTWDRDYLCGWFTMEGRQWIIAPHDVWWPTRLNDLALLGRCAPPLCLWGAHTR